MLVLYPDQFEPGNDYAFASSAPALYGERARGGRPLGETILAAAEASAPAPPAGRTDAALMPPPPPRAPKKRSQRLRDLDVSVVTAHAAAAAGDEKRRRRRVRWLDCGRPASDERMSALVDDDVPLARFRAVSLGPPDESEPPAVEYGKLPHAVTSEGRARFAEPPRETYRDEAGAPIVWPWEPDARGSRDSARTAAGEEYVGGGFLLDHNLLKRGYKRKVHYTDPLIEQALDASVAGRQRGRNRTGVRAWIQFCIDLGMQPERPMDPLAPLYAKLEEEWLAMRFVTALVEERGVEVTTAGKYFSEVQGWMLREFGVKLAGGLKLERLPQMLKGLRKIKGETKKPERIPISPDKLRAAMDELLDAADPRHANLRAAIACAFQGLMRSAEYCGTTGKLMLTRHDIKKLDSNVLVFMMHPCKNMEHIAGKTCPLVIGAGGRFIDAVAEVTNMLAVDPTPRGGGNATPLFREPSTNRPISYDTMLGLTKQIYELAGLDPNLAGTHCWRISGATALFEGGATDTVIRTSGRWSSDLYRLYIRCCFQQSCKWSALAGSTTFGGAAVVYDEVDSY